MGLEVLVSEIIFDFGNKDNLYVVIEQQSLDYCKQHNLKPGQVATLLTSNDCPSEIKAGMYWAQDEESAANLYRVDVSDT